VNLPVPRNVGPIDRVARVALGAAGVAAPVALGAGWLVAVPVGLLAGSVAVSGLLGRCSIYHALGLSTLAGEGGQQQAQPRPARDPDGRA
jgi:hypothetical protein